MDINRKAAYKALLRMEKDLSYSNIEINVQLKKYDPDSPGFVRELVYGVQENKLYLDYFIKQMLKKGLKGLKSAPLTLLRMGLYQIIFMDSVPDYAAVNESVRLARRYCVGQAGLVNAVLRNYLRNGDKLKHPADISDPLERLSYLYSFSPWIVKLWEKQYGVERAEKIMSACNETPPVMIRVNVLKISSSKLKKILEEKGIEVSEFKDIDRILVCRGREILNTDEYRNGYFAVQDAASVIAVETLDPKKGDTVIDVCAAPGGKSFAIAEIMGNIGRVISFDLYENKIKRMRSEAERLGTTIVEAEVQDALEIREDLVGTADKVICDVPCTGLGVIRRKPEIKYKKITDDGLELSKKQLAILEAASKYVKSGGHIMYSTCTVNSIENNNVISQFLNKHDNFDLIRSRQLLPSSDQTDGFYFCKMKKRY